MWLLYVSEEMGIDFPTPIAIGVDSATAVAYANGTVKRLASGVSRQGSFNFCKPGPLRLLFDLGFWFIE